MNHFQNYLVEEFAEDYQEGRLTRREALKLIGSITGSLIVASSILAACAPVEEGAVLETAFPSIAPPTLTPIPVQASSTPSPTDTQSPAATATTMPAAQAGQPTTSGALSGTVAPDDPDVTASDVKVPAEDTDLMAYLARSRQDGPQPVILVCHENRGLTEHIKDVTRRLAKAGYTALAVDLLSRQGGTPAFSADQVPGALGGIDPQQFVKDFISGWEYTKGLTGVTPERVGMVGFCFGGGVTWMVATGMPELLAAVPFYGPPPPVELIPQINAAVLGIYAGNDSRINQSIPAIEEAMKQNNKIYEKMIYPGVDHAFHNDTGTRYAPEAAKDAWARTLAWFEKYVRGA